MMWRTSGVESGQQTALDWFDRAVIGYVVLPLPLFLLGWLELWAAVPLTLCVLYAFRSLVGPRAPSSSDSHITPISTTQLVVASLVGVVWTVLGGAMHFVFANADWYVRDAVLHDLVVSPWPVGYGLFDGAESMLRAPLGYYVPAAVLGKLLGLYAAHIALALWTAMGVTLFLLQVLSLTPSRKVGAALAVMALIVFFSGFDIIGCLVADPERFLKDWKITQHLEWWAGVYQYSSMTTQLFWVPNHALPGWLAIGLLLRNSRPSLSALLPMLVVATVLWSPLTALGLMPFIVLKVLRGASWRSLLPLLRPEVWAPAVLVGLVLASYITMDSVRLPMKTTLGGQPILDLVRQLQFFLLEAGFIGYAVLALGWSWDIVLALAVLLLLPLVSFGPANDLAMRASIPSLAVLAIGVCKALTRHNRQAGDSGRKVLLGCMIGVGALTPIQEIARAISLPAWPINTEATLIGAACGSYEPHYVARLNTQLMSQTLRPPHRIPLGPQDLQTCRNPAKVRMAARGLDWGMIP